jgi:hypothetical protein
MANTLIVAEPRDYALYYPLIRTLLLTLPKEGLESLFLMDEGLENHLVKLAEHHAEFAPFMRQAVTRRYTKARIQRTLTHLMVHTTKTELRKLPPLQTLRVLGFSRKGQRHLRTLRDDGIRVATRFNQIPVPYRRLELKATAAYAHVLSAQARQALLEREIQGPILKRSLIIQIRRHRPKGSDRSLLIDSGRDDRREGPLATAQSASFGRCDVK